MSEVTLHRDTSRGYSSTLTRTQGRCRSCGKWKDIGKDKPAFGWELEPFVAFGSISGNVSFRGKD